VKSALSQRTDFPFNVIAVDNHSGDGTTASCSRSSPNVIPALKHRIPGRGWTSRSGGCWNEAIYPTDCGRYAVHARFGRPLPRRSGLQRLVDLLRRANCAMAVGGVPPSSTGPGGDPAGLIAHREWTEANGANNLLRVNGLGGARAFDTALLRRIGFPNVGYGEDYAVALRLSGSTGSAGSTTASTTAAVGGEYRCRPFRRADEPPRPLQRTGSELWRSGRAER